LICSNLEFFNSKISKYDILNAYDHFYTDAKVKLIHGNVQEEIVTGNLMSWIILAYSLQKDYFSFKPLLNFEVREVFK